MHRLWSIFLPLVMLSGVLAKPPSVAAQEKPPVLTSDKAHPPELSGTVVDMSGAVIAGAAVEVRSADGTVQRTTKSDRSGSFT